MEALRGSRRLRQGLGAVAAASMLLATSCTSSSPKGIAATTTTLSQGATSTGSTALTPPTVAATTSPTTVAPVDSGILVYGDCKTPSLQPSEIVLTCADYGWILEALHWSSWTASQATAIGTFVYNDCTPNCAEGNHHDVPGTQVTLTVPLRDSGGQLVWSELRQNPQPPGYVTGPYHGGPFPLPTRPI
jgi:hypothetical protein